jgi:NitT/TauT family transport system substrate-binding protein
MPSDKTKWATIWKSYPWRVVTLAIAWLIVISALHYWINGESDRRQVIKMGYMPVITNLAAPLLDHVSNLYDSEFRYKAIKFVSFAEMAEALRNDKIQAAFIIAPLAIVLRQQAEDVKVVYIGNRHESTMVARKNLKADSIHDLTGATVAVPMRYSGHNLGMLKLIAEAGLENEIKLVEMNPPDMASALTAGALDAYFVGEPFAAQTIRSGDAHRIFYVEEVWPNFICNLLLVKNRLIQTNPSAIRHLVQGAVRSGIWAERNIVKAAEVASKYWGQPQSLVQYALNTPQRRIVYHRYTPVAEEMQDLADLMVRFDLLKDRSIEGLVDDRFAKKADVKGIAGTESILMLEP